MKQTGDDVRILTPLLVIGMHDWIDNGAKNGTVGCIAWTGWSVKKVCMSRSLVSSVGGGYSVFCNLVIDEVVCITFEGLGVREEVCNL